MINRKVINKLKELEGQKLTTEQMRQQLTLALDEAVTTERTVELMASVGHAEQDVAMRLPYTDSVELYRGYKIRPKTISQAEAEWLDDFTPIGFIEWLGELAIDAPDILFSPIKEQVGFYAMYLENELMIYYKEIKDDQTSTQ